MALTKTQKEALSILKSGKNVFLTGEAGTGKSYLLSHFVTKLKDKNVLITAPTGIAALNVGGATLHRTFKLETDIIGLAEKPNFKSVPDVVKSADVLIIDEVSMCRLDIFEKVLKTLKVAKKSDIQIVLVGDFLQLPPVLTEKEAEIYKHYHGEKILPFQSDLWKKFNFVTIQLKEVVRQKDPDFIHNLNLARVGDKACLSYFNNLDNQPNKEEKPIRICGTNKEANRINTLFLEQLGVEQKVYNSSIEILNKDYKISKSDKVVDDKIILKEGAKVLLCVNLADKKVYNGEIGVVKKLYDSSVLVDFNGKEVEVERYTWTIHAYDVVKDKNGKKKSKLIDIAEFEQIPLKLAFAITIHKSQGQTFDKAVIHPLVWQSGQLYVALSRVANSSGLYLSSKIEDDYLIADQSVLDFYNQSQKSNFVTKRETKKAGRKRKFNGLDTKVMRLPSKFENLLIDVSDKLSTYDDEDLKKVVATIFEAI